MKPLSPHHAAWLAAHPHRTAEWLAERTAGGFDVHHLDGDHGNNDPGNLVLIEYTDHMRLHGNSVLRKLGPPARFYTPEVDERCYVERVAGKLWSEIEPSATQAAKRHALANGLKWPPLTRRQMIELRGPAVATGADKRRVPDKGGQAAETE